MITRSDREACNRRSDFSDRADALVPEDATVLDCWNVAFEDVQVSAANGRGFNLHDDVGRLLNPGIRYVFPGLLAGTVINKRFHRHSFDRPRRPHVRAAFGGVAVLHELR